MSKEKSCRVSFFDFLEVFGVKWWQLRVEHKGFLEPHWCYQERKMLTEYL
jgi:hypothetical protein